MSAATKKPVRTAPRKRRSVAGSKGGESKQKQPVIASNSVPSLSTARIVYLWSWGPIVGPVNGLRSIRLNGTQVQADDGTLNYPGVKWQFRSGELNQERLEGIAESSNEIDVKKELLSTTPWLRTISNSVTDAVRIRFSWPTLRQQDASGNINGVRIDYAVDISTDNGPYIEVLSSFVDRKNLTEYERAHRIELPAGNRWTIRARRLTPEANSDLVVDQMLVKAFAEVVDSDQEFPLTAVGCIEYDAQVFGGDIAKISALMRGRIVRVPANYNAETRTYATGGTGTSNGIWDGTFKEAYTNNPAWVFYDLVLHPYYGLGDRIDATMVDRWSLYRIAQYCDQMVSDGKGGQEPRFTCNLYFQKQAESYAVLQDLASIFHGMAFWDGSQIVVNADMPGDPVYTYNQSQILSQGAIKYEGTRARDRHTLAMVAWDDPEQGFETDKEPVFDDEALGQLGVVRDMSIDAFGCTSLGQAQRAGQWALMTEQLQTRGAVFRVGLDGMIPKPGQVIAIADPMLAGRNNGGRVAAVSGRVVTLDRDTPVPVGARLLCNLPSGKTEARVVKSVSGRKVTLMADYSEIPEAQCGWVLDYDDLKLMQFYVRNITRPEWHQFQFEVIQHEPSKFDVIDHGAVVDTRPISGIPVGTQDAPARVLLSQHVVIEQGIANTIMTIAWDAAPGAVAYDIEWRWGAREWIKVPRTGELSVDVRGIYAGQYMARVRAVSAMQVSSLPTSSILTNLEGKVGLPPAVTHLRTESLVYGIGINWGFPPGAEDTQRTELWQSTANNLAGATKLGDFAYPQARHELQNIVPGTSLFFWARLVDRSGNVGPWFPEKYGINGQPSSDQTEYEKYFAGKIGTGALYPELKKDIELITGDGPGSVKELVEQVKELGDKVEGLVDTFIYDPKLTYKAGENAREGRHIYQAVQDVPSDTPPPNPAYWKDIGEILETANGLAFQVNQNTTSIKDLDGKVTASASSLEALRAAARGDTGEGELADALKSWQSTAELAVEKRVRATEDEAISERVTTFGAQVGENKAGLSSLEKVVATNDSVAAKRITELKGELSDVGSGVAGNTQALETLSGEISRIDGAVVATASSLESLRADARSDTGEGDLAGALDAWSSTANFALEKKVRATAEEALAMKTEQLQVNLNQTTASVEQVSKAVVDVNGRVSAQTTIKAETIVGGRKVMAGLALGSDGDTSEILAFAQRFAIIDEVTGQLRTPFVVQNGQVFINYAMIDTAFIQNLVLGMTLRSSAVNAKGLPLLEINIPQGMLTLRSPGAGGSTTLNNNGLLVQDEDDSVRLRAGNLTLLKAGG